MVVIKITFLFYLSLFCLVVTGRKHKLEIKNDARRYIALSTFGFYKGGNLSVSLSNFHADPFSETDVGIAIIRAGFFFYHYTDVIHVCAMCQFGFTLDRTLSDAMNPYLDSHPDQCLLQDLNKNISNDVIFFILDFKCSRLQVIRSEHMKMVQFTKLDTVEREKREYQWQKLRLHKRQVDKKVNSTVSGSPCPKSVLLPITVDDQGDKKYFNTSFVMQVLNEKEEGLYNLYFHSCPNYNGITKAVDFTIEIQEVNDRNYLSAGEMPLPALYFMMALLFFLSGCFWVFILKKSKNPVYKIHYLMAILVYLKSLSLMFHSINYYFIQTKGEHVTTWAILYYVAHLMKGAVLFITIVLVGTGWTFIKHILSEKDKKIFVIVIPLQVLANVAEIIIEESEEGAVEHRTWRDVFILVDLLCCGAILFPVVWSIRHLQEASHTDGKAAINLRKLKLFRHFYIMIVCYIYFTRIIVYLLKITVPFQYEWLDEMFREMATYVFFVLTGYKFRPASANPYFQLSPEEEEEEEMDVVISQSGFTEGLTKIARASKVATNEDASDEEKDNFLSKRESSHEYD